MKKLKYKNSVYRTINKNPTVKELFLHLSTGGIAERLSGDKESEYIRIKNEKFQCSSTELLRWWNLNEMNFYKCDKWKLVVETSHYHGL